jgi:predicted TPR repeat methyltransferase
LFATALRRLLRRLFGREASPSPSGEAQEHLDRGKALSEAGQHAEAAVAYARATALKPDYAEAHFRLGLAWRDQQRYSDAATSYRSALTLRPDYIEAHNNLGAVLQLQGKLSEALASYRSAVALNPEFSQPYLNFGRLLEALGDGGGAARVYRHAMARGIEPDTFRHLANALAGITTERAPAAYARTVFDNFAEQFDRRLVEELGYRIPQILAECLKAEIGRNDLRVLDLGCGTGLCGAQLRGSCVQLVGVDLSPSMLAKARARGIYHELVEQDLADYLSTAPSAGFDAVVAADVFTYIGELAGIFSQVARTLAGRGVFAFSVEQAPNHEDFVLRSSGRYAQSATYIRRLAAQSGLSVQETRETTIRGEGSHAVNGNVFVLRKH